MINTRFIALILVAVAGYVYFDRHHGNASISQQTSANGFVTLPAAEGQNASTVYVIAAKNCSKEDARRADSLAEQLKDSDIPVTRTNAIQFRFSEQPDKATIDNVNQVMNGKLPIVFIRGRAKSNPSFDEVVAEYKSSTI